MLNLPSELQTMVSKNMDLDTLRNTRLSRRTLGDAGKVAMQHYYHTITIGLGYRDNARLDRLTNGTVTFGGLSNYVHTLRINLSPDLTRGVAQAARYAPIVALFTGLTSLIVDTHGASYTPLSHDQTPITQDAQTCLRNITAQLGIQSLRSLCLAGGGSVFETSSIWCYNLGFDLVSTTPHLGNALVNFTSLTLTLDHEFYNAKRPVALKDLLSGTPNLELLALGTLYADDESPFLEAVMMHTTLSRLSRLTLTYLLTRVEHVEAFIFRHQSTSRHLHLDVHFLDTGITVKRIWIAIWGPLALDKLYFMTDWDLGDADEVLQDPRYDIKHEYSGRKTIKDEANRVLLDYHSGEV